MTAELLLGKKEFVVDLQLESALGAGNEGKRVDDVLIVTENVVCHTGSALLVVSRHAIFQSNPIFVHWFSFFAGKQSGRSTSYHSN